MAMDSETPPFIKELILTHPALLGENFQDLGDSDEHAPLVTATNEIIKAHGFAPCMEWEYECDGTTSRPICLRIWIGKTRTKKNMRKLILTGEEVVRVQGILSA